MSPNWQTILGDTATLTNELPVPAADLADPLLAALQHSAVLDVTGADAQSFLQGQFCNDLVNASVTRAQLSGYCTPKGRLLALFTLYGIEDGYRLILSADLLESMQKRLQMFVMRAAVVLTARDDLFCTGIIAPTNKFPASLNAPELKATMDVASSGEYDWIKFGDNHSMVIASAEEQAKLWSNDIAKTNDDSWRLQNIIEGLPSLAAGTVEEFVPQMLNMQQTNGLSFKKGCYPGQEIVARMQYLGKLKRQMLWFEAAGATQAPEAGSSIVTADDVEAGTVVDAVASKRGVQLLAVMKLALIDQPLKAAGQALIQKELPYSLETKD